MEHLEPPETQRKEGSSLEGAWACLDFTLVTSMIEREHCFFRLKPS